MSDERKRGGPIREDRDEFILKSLQASPDYEDIEGLRLRLMDEGWVEYPHDKLRGKLSTAALLASLRRLKKLHLLPKKSKPKPPIEVKDAILDGRNRIEWRDDEHKKHVGDGVLSPRCSICLADLRKLHPDWGIDTESGTVVKPTTITIDTPIPQWAMADAQRIRALVSIGLRVRLVNGQWEVVP